MRRVERSRWSLICWIFSPNWQFMLTLIAQCSPPNVSCYSCVYLFFTAYICILPGKVFLPKKQFFVFLKWSFLFKKSFQPARFRNVVWIFFKACLRLEFLKIIWNIIIFWALVLIAADLAGIIIRWEEIG